MVQAPYQSIQEDAVRQLNMQSLLFRNMAANTQNNRGGTRCRSSAAQKHRDIG